MRNATVTAITASALLLLGGPAEGGEPHADVKEGPTCRYCGMDREKFASTRMVIEYDDGTKFFACSLHCVAVDLALQIDRTPLAIRVADATSSELIDAEKAHWLLGGTTPGVMTKRAKLAYLEAGAAKAAAKQTGAALITFDDAMKAAYEDMYQDTRMIRERRKAKRAAKAAAAAAAAAAFAVPPANVPAAAAAGAAPANSAAPQPPPAEPAAR
jgi:nitrous oxide reductase accessory protein NosL